MSQAKQSHRKIARPYADDEAEITAALQQIDEAVQLTVKDADKEAYLEAKRLAPELVRRESNPILFLNFCKNDPVAAAKRITVYWTRRKEFFKENAFKPLNQTGSGALNAVDIEGLKTGGISLLPNKVFFIDRTRYSEEMMNNPFCRLRIMFYLISIAVQAQHEEKAPAAPASLVTLLRLTSDTKLGSNGDFWASRAMVDCVQNGMPVNMTEVHLASLSESDGCYTSITMSAWRALIAGLVSIVLRMIGSFSGNITTHHSASSTKEMFQKLKAVGFTKRALPTCLGGNWSEENFQQSQRRQLRIEEELYLTEAQKLQRKREVNRIHSRQKRTRRRIEWEVLHEQCAGLQKQRESLQQENRELEALLKTAQNEVKLYEQGKRGSKKRDHSGAPVPAQAAQAPTAVLQQQLERQRKLESLTQASLLQQQQQQRRVSQPVAPPPQVPSTMASFMPNEAQDLVNLLAASSRNLQQQQQQQHSTAAQATAALAAPPTGQQLSTQSLLNYSNNVGEYKSSSEPTVADLLLLHQQQQQEQQQLSQLLGLDTRRNDSDLLAGLLAQQQLQRQQESLVHNNQFATTNNQLTEDRRLSALRHSLGTTVQRLSHPSIPQQHQPHLYRNEGEPNNSWKG